MQIYPLLTSPVAQARRRLGLSRTEAAAVLGVSPGHLRIVESQTRRISLLVLDQIVATLEAAVPTGGTGILYFPDATEDGDVAR